MGDRVKGSRSKSITYSSHEKALFRGGMGVESVTKKVSALVDLELQVRIIKIIIFICLAITGFYFNIGIVFALDDIGKERDEDEEEEERDAAERERRRIAKGKWIEGSQPFTSESSSSGSNLLQSQEEERDAAERERRRIAKGKWIEGSQPFTSESSSSGSNFNNPNIRTFSEFMEDSNYNESESDRRKRIQLKVDEEMAMRLQDEIYKEMLEKKQELAEKSDSDSSSKGSTCLSSLNSRDHLLDYDRYEKKLKVLQIEETLEKRPAEENPEKPSGSGSGKN